MLKNDKKVKKSKIFLRMSEKSSTFARFLEPDRLEMGVHKYDYELDSAWFEAVEKSEIQGGKVQCHAILAVNSEGYSLSISCRGTVQVICDRCLDLMDVDVDVQEDEVESEDTKRLDLEWLAYEIIATSLPMVHRHPEGGCDPNVTKFIN